MIRASIGKMFVLIWSVILSATGTAQSRFQNDGQIHCADCFVELGPPLELRDSPRVPLGTPADIVRTEAGQLLVLVWTSPDEILVFDRNGRPLGTVGRPGAGPGEFGRIAALAVGPADTLYVADNGNGRISVFAPDLTPVTTMRMWGNTYWGEMVAIPSGGVLVSARRITADGWSDSPLHFLRTAREPVVSFGRLPDHRPTKQPYLTTRRIASGRSGRVWAAMENEYRVEEWGLDGTPLTVITGQREWFAPYDDPLADHDRAPPVPRIQALHALPGGNLAVLLWRAAPSWRDGMEWRDGHDGKYLIARRYWLAYDSVIDIINPRNGELITTTTVSGTVIGFVDSQSVWDYAEDEGGNPRISIRDVTLRQ